MSATVARAGSPPGPEGLEPLRWLREVRRDPLSGFLAAVHRYGDVVRFPLPPGRSSKEFVLVAHPEGVQHVLQSNHTNYRRAQTYDMLKLLLGDGLLTADGDVWKRHRRMIQPGFHTRRIAGFADVMVDETLRLVDDWQRRPHGATFDVASAMQRLTLRIVGRTLFSSDLGPHEATIARALSLTLKLVRERADSLLPLSWTRPTPTWFAFRRASRDLNTLVDELVRERRPCAEEFDDLLSMLLLAQDAETGARLDDRQVRDEIVTFMLAGHETTANALTWAWYLLAHYPKERDRLHDEVDEVLGGAPPSFETVRDLEYTDMVISEAMRLYPPAWMIERAAIGHDEIGCYRIAPDTLVATSPWITHHHPEVWDDAAAFVPERFAPDDVEGRHRFAYFPFGAGPRMCIGRPFALLEAPLVLATIAQRYELALVPGFPVELEPSVTLRPRHGIRMTAHPRS